jgi:2-oxoglutarate ferredoxin oxidoreductase subunit beta
MLSAGATFIARAYSNRSDSLGKVVKEAIKHKGFSVVDILQPCYTFFNTCEFYNEHVYETSHDYTDLGSAKEKIVEWDYNSGGRIPIGILYKKEEDTFDSLILVENKLMFGVLEILERHV